MPDPVTQTPPSTPAAPATTSSTGAASSAASTPAAPASAPSRPKGIEGLMADALKPATPPAKPDTAKPAEKPAEAPATPDKPAGQPPAKPQGKQSDVRTNFARLEQQLTETQKADREKAAKIAEYEKRIQETESKARQTEADAKRVKEMEARIAQLQGELSQTAYERSDEFKSKYVEPFNKQWASTLSLVKQLTITEGDEVEGQTKRQATDADFQKVFNAPVSEQALVAQQIFGPNASLVLHKIARLEDMRDQANADVEAHKTDYEKNQQERATTIQKQQQDFERYHDAAASELEEKYKDYFATPEHDPEAADALKGGYELVDTARKNGSNLNTEERAAYAAVIRARAAAFPLLVLQAARKDQRIAALEEKLAKYEGSNPGGGQPAPGGQAGKEGERKGKGVAGLAMEF